MWVEKNGPTWRIREQVGDKKHDVAIGFTTKTAAKAAMTHLASDKLAGRSLVNRGGEITLNDWLDIWWPSYETTLRPSSRTSAEGIQLRYIRPMLGDAQLGDISRLTIRRWVSDLREGRTRVEQPKPLSRKTIANAHGLLHKVLSDAVLERLIGGNPCAGTRIGTEHRPEMEFLTEQQAEALLLALPEHDRPLVYFLLGTGCRWSEAVGLRARDIDLLERRVTINKALHEVHHSKGYVETAPKTKAGRRTLSIPISLALVLTPLLADREPDDHVFLAPKGGNMVYMPFWRRWDIARRAAGVPNLRIHDLRHTHASWLLASNVTGGVTAIQRRLGHSSIRVTSDLYGHLMPEVDDSIIDALEIRLPKIESRGDVGGMDTDQDVSGRESAEL